jgi:hypothetical protein
MLMSWAGCNVSSPVTRRVGAQCGNGDDCDDVCLVAPEYPGGFCTLSCDDEQTCPGETVCVDPGQWVCLFACDEPADCAFLGAGWTCAAKSRISGGETSVCVGE